MPALRLRLLHTLAERSGRHVAVGAVRCRGRLADDELLEVDAVLLDLEHRRARERAPGLGEQALAVRVQALVVELDVVLSTKRKMKRCEKAALSTTWRNMI